ncbi:retinoic acid early transcript 1E-like isoform X2 [Erinaceus europaeus]|uniref:Retinoic acid early transcript 1E-like isoform X2 n=1 Tax=Erinaceus europaeus TaxID=9365 RepID=A0ABM3YJR8_ERIEU|nr:retinoic acid early transcript 1E-like isoform X2 [Erinaceus europaeus]
MELAAPTAGLGLILLLLEARETLGGAHSLCLNFTVRSQASPGQSWCEAQGSVDGKPFLQYGSDSSKATPVGLLGEKVNATKAWKELSQTLEEVGRELRMVLLVTKPEKSLSGESPQKTPDSNQRSFILAGIIPLIIILSITIFMIHRKCSAVPAEASWGQERATSLDQQLMT